MARSGMDVSLICLFGRGGSSAVLGYIKEAPLTTSSSWSSIACAGVTREVQSSEKEVDRLVAKVAGGELAAVLAAYIQYVHNTQ
eukprot:2860123-Amphidinium_carterae.1